MSDNVQMKSIQPRPSDRANMVPDAHHRAGENLAKLQELAKLAAAAKTQQQTQRKLDAAGFSHQTRHIEREGRVERVDLHEAGGIVYRTMVAGPSALIELLDATDDSPALESLHRDYQAAKFHSEFGAIRFACGRLWYTLTKPWTTDRLAAARSGLRLSDAAKHDQVERHLHFRFQRLYRKPPDDWSDAEVAEWDVLLKYIDFDAYELDNQPTDNRIGRVLHIDADEVVIFWSSNGESIYDSRSVPPELLSAPEGWLIHAEFHIGNGVEIWLSARVEPPVDRDDKVVADDLSSADISTLTEFPKADWPKIEG
jgi:hypothetical protein